jgi:hypothetical protein
VSAVGTTLVTRIIPTVLGLRLHVASRWSMLQIFRELFRPSVMCSNRPGTARQLQFIMEQQPGTAQGTFENLQALCGSRTGV